MEKRGLRQVDLVKLTGYSQPTVANWLNGRTTNLKSESAIRAAKALNVSVAWLTQGIGSVDQTFFDNNVRETSLGCKRIPIISYVQAGLPNLAVDNRNAEDFVLVDQDYKCSELTFALIINGDSMEPKFSEGDVIIVDPELRPHPGDYVVASTENGEEATFKKYRVVGMGRTGQPVFELVPLNTDYPILRSDSLGLSVIGVMIEHRTYYRRRH
jgi:SOS-response transcriptional repressor LexA